MDVSGSMYRFNGYDGRLEREMEAVCMVMEAFQGYSEKLKVRDLHQRLQYYFTVCLLKPLVLVTHPCHFRLQSHTRVPFFVKVTHLCHFRCWPYTRVTLHYSHIPVSRYVTVTSVSLYITVTHLCHFRCRSYTCVPLRYSHIPVSLYVTVTHPCHVMLQSHTRGILCYSMIFMVTLGRMTMYH